MVPGTGKNSITAAVACAALLLVVAALPGALGEAAVADLRPFTSDGCSLFPDGTFTERSKWCECCFAHDIAYWRGGTTEERKQADQELRDCVRERTGDPALAETMYFGVRTGGHPVFPTWYRWGYGWNYGRGYQPLSESEQMQVQQQLDAYRKKHPSGYCRSD